MTDRDAQPPQGEERSCQQCGESLAPKAAFCRSCGAKYEAPAPPEPDVDEQTTEVREAEPTATMPAEPSCGNCGAALAPSSAFCRACGTPVPAEGAPTQKLDPAPQPPPAASRPAPPPPPAVAPPPTPPPPPPAAPAPLAAAGGSRSKVPFIIGGLVLLIAAGVAVAIVASKGSSPSQPTALFERAGAETANEEEPGGEMVETEEEAVEEEPVEAEGEVSTAGFPEVPRSQMDEEITSLLESYHEDVVEEDFQGAWAMLTPRKRRQYLREYGYHKWSSAQASLSPYLDPYGLEANVVSLEGEGVARVDVTGMGWSKAGAPCSEWSGLTWVKYEGEEWAYDPGYSTTSARRATWRPRSARLLGGDCAE